MILDDFDLYNDQMREEYDEYVFNACVDEDSLYMTFPEFKKKKLQDLEYFWECLADEGMEELYGNV